MSYFPAFISLHNKKVLLVGGGAIALEKLEKLLDFTQEITLISQNYDDKICNYVTAHNLTSYQRAYQKGDVQGFDIVIIAVDDLNLQGAIYEETRSTRTLCNAVDSVDFCDFIFPSYIKEEELIIAVSTSGASPAIAKYLRRFLHAKLPVNLMEFFKEMKTLRKSLPKGKERMQVLEQKAKEFFS